ncbi:hypothetical protein [Methanocella sp. MCL-LM]|uniref:hypothetical protein n=1 Tax=Methanocella sp. MCL-LM TaxID=3412035 RepID=UPI003C78FC43
MAPDIFEIKLNKRQEKKALEIASRQGNFTLFLGKEGKIRISEEKEKPKKGETHAATVDASNNYYEWLIGWLAQQGIVPSEDLVNEIERLFKAERDAEDEEFGNTVNELDAATAGTIEKLRVKLAEEMCSDTVSNKQKNDYRCVIKRLDARDYNAEYIARWTARTMGDQEGLAYAGSIKEIESDFGTKVIRQRMYGRIFLDDAKPIKPGKGLKWIRLAEP